MKRPQSDSVQTQEKGKKQKEADVFQQQTTIRRREGGDLLEYVLEEPIVDVEQELLCCWNAPKEMIQFYGKCSLSLEQEDQLRRIRSEEAKRMGIEEQDLQLGVKCAYKKVVMKFVEDESEEDIVLEVGDFARVTADLPHDTIMRLDVLFVDHEDKVFVKCWWFYVDFDTPLNVPFKGSGIDKNGLPMGNGKDCCIPFVESFGNRLWMATPQDNERFNTINHLNTIEKVIKVVYVAPDQPPPPPTKDVYWFDQKTCLQHWNFEDVQLPSNSEQQTSSPESKNQRKKQNKKRILRVLDIYSGCGGTGFMSQASDEECEIQHTWSCDIEKSMVYAIKLNSPESVVFAMSVDELLEYSCWLCKIKVMLQKQGFKIRSFKDVRDEPPTPYGVIDVQIKPITKGVGLDMSFLVGQQVSKRGVWMSMEKLLESDALTFCNWIERQTLIPVPGNVDVVIGGPPCQGISGLNRHAQGVDILNDARNSQIKSYCRALYWFQPRYCMMEQVQNIASKEHGLYLKFAQVILVLMRYQTRVALCYAGYYGCPQTRVRVFMWGAAPGEQLPPFPAPVHRVSRHLATFNNCDPLFVKIENPDHHSILPSVRMGDILFDVPNLSNFTHGEVRKRKEVLVSPYQLWLQRQPTTRYVLEQRNNLIGHPPIFVSNAALQDCDSLWESGLKYECAKNFEGSKHAAKTWRAFIRENKSWLGVSSNFMYLRQFRQYGFQKVGTTVVQDVIEGGIVGNEFEEQMKKNREMEQWVTDCVPLRCNNDDYWRMAEVPVGSGSCFRNMRGLYNDPIKGYCCAGHHHAYRFPIDEQQAVRERILYGKDAVFNDPGDGFLINKKRGSQSSKEPLASIAARLNKQSTPGDQKPEKSLSQVRMDENPEASETASSPVKDSSKRCSKRLARCETSKSVNSFNPGVESLQEQSVSVETEAGCSSKILSGGVENMQIDDDEVVMQKSKGKSKNLLDLVYCACPAGGHMRRPKSSRSVHGRVDYNARDMPGITHLQGCPAKLTFLPSLDLLVPRWCVTYKEGKNGKFVRNPSTDIFDYVKTSRNVCYGRLWWSDVVATVVTRAEPHNLQVVHPVQSRVLSPREFARCQGFPDHHVLAYRGMEKGWRGMEEVRSVSLNTRYQQVGNAVAPLQAAYLGQCLKLAAKKQVEGEQYVVRVRHPPYEDLIDKGLNQMGLKFWEDIRKDVLKARNQSVDELDADVDGEDDDELDVDAD